MSAEARNLLRELGFEVDGPPALSPPEEMTHRTRPSKDEDEELLRRIDERAIMGDVDVDELLPLLRCQDAETRDHLLWGLECGLGTGLETEIHRRADTFLSVLDEPDECARSHLFRVLGAVVSRYPESWVPALATLVDHDDTLVRDGVLRLLGSAAGTAPSLVIDDIDLIRDALTVDPLREAALIALRPLVSAFPERTEEFIPDVIAMIEPSEVGHQALFVVNELAYVNPEVAIQAIRPVIQVVTQLAGETAVEERARLGREGHAENVDIHDKVLKRAFEVSAQIASIDPELVTEIHPYSERMIDGRYYGYRSVLMLGVRGGVLSEDK